MTHLVWFRNDCRILDHAALTEACKRASRNGRPVKAVFLWTPGQWERHDYGLARQYSWSRALDELNSQLARLGIELSILHADTWLEGVETLAAFARENSVTDVYFHREFGWDEVRRDQTLLEYTSRSGIGHHVFEDRVIQTPEHLLTGQQDVYRVFTPFKKRWLSLYQEAGMKAPLPAPQPVADAIMPTATVPDVDWDGDTDMPLTEHSALEQLDRFVNAMPRYRDQRDQPGTDGTSRLSAALANGAVSLRQCFQAAFTHPQASSDGVQTWVSELIWREFYLYLLYWRPELAKHQPFYPRWDAFPWSGDRDTLKHWQQGKTGVPIVDAGMRQLSESGWMHNRVRMITAMYLVKLLQIDWREGERWFARQLLDIDFASNNGGWQWCASTGVDAAPYFRIFNPYTQSERFDPNGHYIRRWLPELSGLDVRSIHNPSDAQRRTLGYTPTLVDYKTARADTLARFKQL
ncbi:cryptochrome/photolyase family protein [Saccharospirillum salsuginis]|uniref:Deoxyribodipyrimidine photo-lyase n=1 Tax=Saccharospirillum salsuginis TaxID=418750 RepID=A0A918NE10_9GAMM|nr:FAD-binding domain-containing protein [Saccharospirillum salsuginis]GGX61050.1 deoxyribodipyrimidine photo-lyase [Saccharospirillum salsuginis]